MQEVLAEARHVIVRQFGWQQWRTLTVIRKQKSRDDLCSHNLANLKNTLQEMRSLVLKFKKTKIP